MSGPRLTPPPPLLYNSWLPPLSALTCASLFTCRRTLRRVVTGIEVGTLHTYVQCST